MRLHALLPAIIVTTATIGCSDDSPPNEAVGQRDRVSFSPDGRWLAYRSEDGEIVVEPYPGTEADKLRLFDPQN